MRKTLGKPLVLQRRGQDSNFLMFSQWFWKVREVLVGDWNIAKNPTGGRLTWTNSLPGQTCLFRLGPTQDPKIQVLPSWHLELVSVAIPP